MRFNNIYSYRNHTCLIFSFELPIMGAMQAPPNSTMALYVVNVREKFIAQLMLQTRPKLHGPLLSSSSRDANRKSYKSRKQRFGSFQYMCDHVVMSFIYLITFNERLRTPIHSQSRVLLNIMHYYIAEMLLTK